MLPEIEINVDEEENEIKTVDRKMLVVCYDVFQKSLMLFKWVKLYFDS